MSGGRRLALAGALAALALAVFWPALRFGFVDYDDPTYILASERVLEGLGGANLWWACSTTYFSNWHPLTWVSLMLDADLWGGDPRGFHATSLWIHAANAALLFLLLERTTGAAVRAAIVAALFAVHPLHVEPVVWISSRKDVLSTLFGLVSLLAWAAWTERGGGLRYAGALAAYAASLLSKQMLVTLPFLLVVLDVWPLRRVEWDSFGAGLRGLLRRLPEKLPFFALAAAASAAVYQAQQAGGAIRDLEVFPFGMRVANALTVYVIYSWKTLWPVELSALYPYPETIPTWQVASASALLVAVTATVLLRLRQQPYLAVGWLWYVGTLVPVIGLVQIGEQQMADRYTYVPLIGLFVALVWLAAELVTLRALVATATVVILVLAVVARAQTWHWRDSFALFSRAVATTERNAVAHNNLGTTYGQAGRIDEALQQFREASRIDPGFADAQSNLGNALLQVGRIDEAEAHFVEALRLDPDLVAARMNYGLVLERTGRLAEAVEQYERAAALNPESAEIERHAAQARERLAR